jgi:hypothetical protein
MLKIKQEETDNKEERKKLVYLLHGKNRFQGKG